MERDLLIFTYDNGEERYKLLSIIDNQYIIYTTLTNINPMDNIHIIKVKSLNELDIIPITNEETDNVLEKYKNLIK